METGFADVHLFVEIFLRLRVFWIDINSQLPTHCVLRQYDVMWRCTWAHSSVAAVFV